MAFEDAYGEVLSTSVVAGYYDEVNDDYASVLRSLLPTGPAWTFEDDSDMYALLRAMSYAWLRVRNRGLDLIEEFDPRTTFELLSDWERVLDLPGTIPTAPTTLAGRRAAVHAKLLGFGDPTASFFEDVAEGAGYDVIIKHKDFDPFVPGSRVGDPLTQRDWAFFWRVITVPGSDDSLLSWWIDLLTPLHTDSLVVYLGETWAEQTNPKNLRLWDVAHDGSGRWCAVGEPDGIDSYIITSEGFENCPSTMRWDERAPTVAKVLNIYCVAHDQSSLWCAVGENDGADSYIITSPDAITWTQRGAGLLKNVSLSSVAYGNGLWVAVGGADGADAYILTSTDGTTWTERANPKNFALYGVAYDGSGLWVAVGVADGSDAYLLTSTDGTTWSTERSNPKNFDLNAVAYGNGLWVAVGVGDGTDSYIVTSTDGTTWTERAPTVSKNTALLDVVYIDLGLWVAVGVTDADAYILTSPDGVTWTERTNPKAFSLTGVGYNNGELVAVGFADGTDAYIVSSG
jgi:uncharacterized protein YmfQ (DUF2313 family)